MLHKCPRCKSEWDELKFFQPPVRICLVCYAMIPENRGLNIVQLRAKAQGSLNARHYTARKRNQVARQSLVIGLDSQLPSDIMSAGRNYIPPEMVYPDCCEGLGSSCTSPNTWMPGDTPITIHRLIDGDPDTSPTFVCANCCAELEARKEARRPT